MTKGQQSASEMRPCKAIRLTEADLKRLDKDQLAKLMARIAAASIWKESPSYGLQKICKSPLFKDAIKLTNQIGKKDNGYENKTIDDWIRDLNPSYTPKK